MKCELVLGDGLGIGARATQDLLTVDGKSEVFNLCVASSQKL
jgi:hypothetical protein